MPSTPERRREVWDRWYAANRPRILAKMMADRRTRGIQARQRSLGERLWEKVQKTETCWLWQGTIDVCGYGRIGRADRPNRKMLAHRAAYTLAVGPIPSGYSLDHLCRVRACVNPAHLEPVTHAENMRRARDAKGHCPHGHPYDVVNTYLDASGWRHCRTCTRDGQRRLAGQHSREA